MLFFMVASSVTAPVSIVFNCYRLTTDDGAIDFRCETDVGASWLIRKGLSCKPQLADYRSGDDPGDARPDTIKARLTLVWVVIQGCNQTVGKIAQGSVRSSLIPISRISLAG